jgi:hypothetical protein
MAADEPPAATVVDSPEPLPLLVVRDAAVPTVPLPCDAAVPEDDPALLFDDAEPPVPPDLLLPVEALGAASFHVIETPLMAGAESAVPAVMRSR